MKDILIEIIKSIVDKPEAVQVEENVSNGLTMLMVTVDKDDMGKVIGKGGKIIKAIRNIMHIKAIKEQKRIMINLVEHAD